MLFSISAEIWALLKADRIYKWSEWFQIVTNMGSRNLLKT